MKIEEINIPVALYGLGTETERFINKYSSQLSIVGILDGFKDSGELYGYPIIPLSKIPSYDVFLIIVIARPGSCKVIAKRIGGFCIENNIGLYDVRGRNLLASTSVTYEFSSILCLSKQELVKSIDASDIISFDLFDTLVMRKVTSYTDVFDLLNLRLRATGIYIPDFVKLRLYAEKEMAKNSAPRLVTIYEKLLELIGGNFITASELSEMEWELDSSLLTVRDDVREMFKTAVKLGKKVVITTDSYYSIAQIEQVLNKFELKSFDNIVVSCEYGTAKTQELYEEVKKLYPDKSILHIGDDEYADIEKAKEHDIQSFRIYSAVDLLGILGGLGLEDIYSISDRIKVGLFLSRIFNSPFWFDGVSRRLSVTDASDIGYLFCAPMITDFIHWIKANTTEQGFNQILFGARDGYLIGWLFRMVGSNSFNNDVGMDDKEQKSFYFLTSRTAAIRAGIDSEYDLEYVESMKYFGSQAEALRVRFGIDTESVNAVDKVSSILEKSKQQKENYKLYIKNLGVKENGKNGRNEKMALFDFVAKGTVQMYLSKLFKGHIKGFYFLQLEPEFMADKGLDIEPFYSDEEKNTSAIFDNYYILETVLTSPYPQLLEMDVSGNPVFDKETRSKAAINVLKQAQDGIMEYFKEYIRIVPQNARTINKKLDERFLELVNKVQILDEEFLNIKVEDPFFGRMTDIKDVLG